MEKIVIKTSKQKEVVDITDIIQGTVTAYGWENGICNIFVEHTSATVTTADLDPGTDQDMLDAFEEMVPKLEYRHPHDPSHVGDHIMSSLIGPSLTVPVERGVVALGQWQRIVLVEFNGPRERMVAVSFVAAQKS